ncbi:hypothetical protein [Fluviicola chungangensis]|uniref:Uncharacterized protein n=1 Tax=Fluviicola chungangensis TaxID=2597671 RepID=A0A556MYI2_9FLAO|nr:hypothetical protein [Fluviicola chungangensis]TSJ44980.1 hypothetical protein FO442_10310 [Fluviicola chungangensis]
MEYSIDARFVNNQLGIRIHFLTTINASDYDEALLFQEELLAGFHRMKWEDSFVAQIENLDNNEQLRNLKYEEMDQLALDSDNTLIVEQFFLDDPDQSKSVIENYIQNVQKEGKHDMKYSSRKYEIPIRVKDLNTGKRITGEFSCLRIEQLIPKSL